MSHPSQSVYPPGPSHNTHYQTSVAAQPHPVVGRVGVGRKPIGNVPQSFPARLPESPATASQNLHRQSSSSAASVWSLPSATSSQTSPSPTVASLHAAPTAANAPVSTHYSQHCNLCKIDVTKDPLHLECLACTSAKASTLYCNNCCIDRGAIKNHHHHFSHFVSVSDELIHDPAVAAHGWEVRKSSLNVTWYHHKASGTKTYNRPNVPVPAPQTHQTQPTHQTHQKPQIHPTRPTHPIQQTQQAQQTHQTHQSHLPQKIHPTQTAQVNSNVPSGWEEIKDPDGRLFYYHRATKTSKWTRPGLSPLPPGWTETMNPDGRTHYRHIASGTLTWNRPGSSAPNNQAHNPATTSASPQSYAPMSNPQLANNGNRLSQSFSSNNTSQGRLPSISGPKTAAMMQSTKNAAGAAGQGFKSAAQKFKNNKKAQKIAAGVGMSVVNSILRENVGISLGNGLVGLVGNDDDDSGMGLGMDMLGDIGGDGESFDMTGDDSGGFDMTGDGGGFDMSGDMGDGGGSFDMGGDIASGGGLDMSGDMGGGVGSFDISGDVNTNFDVSGGIGGGGEFDMTTDMGGAGSGFDMSGDVGGGGGFDMTTDMGGASGGFDIGGDAGSGGGLDTSGDISGGDFDNTGDAGGGFDMSGNMIGVSGSFDIGGDAGSITGGFDMSGNLVDAGAGLDLSGDFAGGDRFDDTQDGGDQTFDYGVNGYQNSYDVGDPNGEVDRQYLDTGDNGDYVDPNDDQSGQDQNQGVQQRNFRPRPRRGGLLMQALTQRPNATQQRIGPRTTLGNAQGPRRPQIRPTAAAPVPGRGSNQQRISRPQPQQRPNQSQATNLHSSTHNQKPTNPPVSGQPQPHNQQQQGQVHRPNPQQNRPQPHSQQQPGQIHGPNPHQNRPQKPNQAPNRAQQQNQNQSNQRPQRPNHQQGAAPPKLPPNNPPRPRPNQLAGPQNQNSNPAKPRPLFSRPNPQQQQALAQVGQSIVTSIIRNAARPQYSGDNDGTNDGVEEYEEVDIEYEATTYEDDGYAQEYSEGGLEGNDLDEDYQEGGDFDDGNLDQEDCTLNDLDQLNIQDGEYNLNMEPDTCLEGGGDDGNYGDEDRGLVDDGVNYDEGEVDQLSRGIGDYDPGAEVPKESTDPVQKPNAAPEENTKVQSENIWNESWFATTTKAPVANSTNNSLTSASVSGPMGFFDPFAPYDPGLDDEDDPSPTATKAETATPELMSTSITGIEIAEISGITKNNGAVDGSAIPTQEAESEAIVQQELNF